MPTEYTREMMEAAGEVKFQREQSEFNSSLQYINYLNYYLNVLCSESSRNLELRDWFHNLMVVYRMLITKATEEEIKNLQEDIKKIESLLGSSFLESRKLYYILHNFESNLRIIMKKAGLEVKSKEDIMMPEESWTE